MKIDVEVSKIYRYTDPAHDLYMCGALNVGRRGYFSDHADFSDVVEGILEKVYVEPEHKADTYYPFKIDNSLVGFKFFCPEGCAVEAQPELRPYKTIDELPFRVGDSVTFRKKGAKEQMMLICAGIIVNGPQLAFIHLGACVYGPESLFVGYEYFNGKEWVPFGVEV